MRRDSRLSIALHTLVHMADSDGPVTSEAIARMAETHAVVMRRTLAGLREAGIVTADKGHGGGFRLGRAPRDITLADIYVALGITNLFAIGMRSENPECLVERAVNHAMGVALEDAEALLVSRLKKVTLADLASEVGTKRRKKEHTHG
jgi:Rrf2 family protein